ncbi:MAG: T9SS type A sorting domain-containing protein, partial [Bacteroidota bacterium]
ISGGIFTEYDRHALESGETTSLQEITSTGKDLDIFPNPASGRLFFQENLEGWSNWTIYNLSGQAVARSRARELPDVTGLPAGMYCLEIRLNSGVLMKKLAVQH